MNKGTASAHNVMLTRFSIKILAGAGQVSYLGTTPVIVGSIAPGASTSLTLSFKIPAAVKKVSISEEGTLENGNNLIERFSLGQAVYINSDEPRPLWASPEAR